MAVEMLPAASIVSQTDVADGSIRLGSGSNQSAREKEAGISGRRGGPQAEGNRSQPGK